ALVLVLVLALDRAQVLAQAPPQRVLWPSCASPALSAPFFARYFVSFVGHLLDFLFCGGDGCIATTCQFDPTFAPCLAPPALLTFCFQRRCKRRQIPRKSSR